VHIFRKKLASGEVDYEGIICQLERSVTKVPILEFMRRGVHLLPPKEETGRALAVMDEDRPGQTENRDRAAVLCFDR
jgi:hypothetical protein